MFFILVLVLGTFNIEAAFSQSNACQDNSICVHPGDNLRYTASLGAANSSRDYQFGDLIDSSHIKVTEKYLVGETAAQNSTVILDLKTGLVQYDQKNSSEVPFLVMLPVPIQYNKTNPSVTQEITDFNGFKRTALVDSQSGENSTSEIYYDMETGILLNEHSLSIAVIAGKPELIKFSNNLANTNIIKSDSTSLQISNDIAIPSWIKSDAKMWSQNDIDDSEFIKAIQYLISNGIMHIPHGTSMTSSTQQIPYWIKSNAGWWSQNKISDNDFVSGVQYLISVGIIRV